MTSSPTGEGERTIYLLRHGAIQKLERKTYIGQLDLPLSPEGIQQAEAWRAFFQDCPPDTIHCSDLDRTHHTARIIAGDASHRIRLEPALREISLGKWEGVPMAEIRQKFPNEWACRGNHLDTFRPPGGESFADLAARVLPAFQRIQHDTTGNALIVAHAGVNRVILAEILGIGLNVIFRIRQGYGEGYALTGGKVRPVTCFPQLF